MRASYEETAELADLIRATSRRCRSEYELAEAILAAGYARASDSSTPTAKYPARPDSAPTNGES